MNPDQLGGQLRTFIPFVAGWLAGAHILFDGETWNIILGGTFTVGLAVWSYINKTAEAQKARVAAMPHVLVAETKEAVPITTANNMVAIPGVTKIITTPEVALATPSTKIVTG